ncbi:MAG: class I SAM-dependent methyltransferase [Campylobacterales bacterium]|nr:class I SAM-dependent methyltransferase [Campylobacterales bacterium]
MQNQYQAKEEGYFLNIRRELLELIPDHLRHGSILEVGAGSGETLRYAKEHGYADHIYGIELTYRQNVVDDINQFDAFIFGNIEDLNLEFEPEQFDIIICADVLEHLINPAEVLKKLKKYLKNGGIIISSIPNFRAWSNLKKICIDGDFRYTTHGILDETHLRFFCKKNIEELFQKNGYTVINNISNIDIIGKKSKVFNKLTCRKFEEFLTGQYFTLSRKEI